MLEQIENSFKFIDTVSGVKRCGSSALGDCDSESQLTLETAGSTVLIVFRLKLGFIIKIYEIIFPGDSQYKLNQFLLVRLIIKHILISTQARIPFARK